MTVTIEDCRKRNIFLRTALNCNFRTEGVWEADGGVVGLVSGMTVHANLKLGGESKVGTGIF